MALSKRGKGRILKDLDPSVINYMIGFNGDDLSMSAGKRRKSE